MAIPSSMCDENGIVTEGPFKGSHTMPHSVERDGKNREIIYHYPTEPERETGRVAGSDDEYRERHPAFGMVSAHRVSSSPPGTVLFDSDIRHREFMRVTLKRCTRDRGLSRDWLHETGNDLIEIDMSMAQWAAFVSSTNTSGVPCTIRATETNRNVDGLHYEPRLHESMDEVQAATHKMIERLQKGIQALDALDPKAGVKERRAALAEIRSAAAHAVSNTEFVAKSLEEHAEKVTVNMKADIEAMVFAKAQQLGLTGEQSQQMLEDLTAPGRPLPIENVTEAEVVEVEVEDVSYYAGGEMYP